MKAGIYSPNGYPSLFDVVGYAIASEDGVVANSQGQMPSTLVISVDHSSLSEQLDRSSILVLGRNSRENHPSSGQRKRLISSRMVGGLETCDTCPNAFYWEPCRHITRGGSVGAWCFRGSGCSRAAPWEEGERMEVCTAGRRGTDLHASGAYVPRAAEYQTRARAPSTCRSAQPRQANHRDCSRRDRWP